ncbi:MAG: glycosyltransferase WbuB [Chloroflexi bacterium]|nr:MAG: glycosyltransferase WbuB [Chloroflexota bacterium]MBL1194620.1 glycosyltransferase WbuB [Chloroflexota bacterium]NOH11910.1 glycosyltransferase family 4 protein [Chloroflexota bacterium]
MHILLIHQAFAALNEPGGTRHHEFARYLAQQGHRVTVIASPVSYLTGSAEQAKRVEQDEYGVTVLRSYTYNALHRSFVHRVFSFLSFMASSFITGLRVKNVDLVWGTSPPIFQGVTAWALARLKGVPFLFEVRDLWPAFAEAVGVLTNPTLIAASRWLERFLYRRADQVMVNSPGFIEHIQARGAKDIVLIPNGADAAMFDPEDDGAAFRQTHNLKDKFIALYAGAHGLSNDLNIVLDAAQQLQANPNIAIVLLGDGKDKATLQQRAAEMQLSNVHFLPPVAKTEMAQALAAADVCIAILKPIEMYKTVYPNKVFDYMAAGRPVLLAIDGVIREVVEAGDAGLFVQPGNPTALAAATAQLANDPQAAQQMGRKARSYLEQHFDRSRLASKLQRVIEELGKRE